MLIILLRVLCDCPV